MMENKKTIKCAICGKEIVKDHNRRKYCLECRRKVDLERKRLNEKRFRKEHPEIIKERKRKYLEKNPDYWKKYYERRKKDPNFRKKMNEWYKNSRDRRRKLCLEHYGGKPPKCACCGEKHIEFLGIDHIGGGGRQHRKKIKKKYRSIYDYLFRNNFPEGYRVLCHNCNMSIGFYGYCPHQKENDNSRISKEIV